MFFNPQLFLCRFGFQPHISDESGRQICNFFNLLSRVETFEYAVNPEPPGQKKKKILADFYYVFKTNPRGLNLNFCNSIITVQFFVLLILLCFQDKSIQDYDIKLTYSLQTTHRQLKYLAISLQSPDEFSPKPHIKSASKA